ncbi:MAG: cation diffusion facilitator family transporter [Helicobacteraceae bacterium]|nr:cation diffusion facilitator family transporter [Helicobacteraceae bacterium]
MAKQERVVLIVSFLAFILSSIKFIVALISGSVVILASALDSLFDTMFSVFNYFALKKSKSIPNKYFNYGFGKIEGMASLFEGFIIFISGIYIIYKSIVDFISNEEVTHLNESMAVMLFSIIATFILVFLLKNALKKSPNLILESEILHYKSDLLSNLGVLISLIIISFSGISKLDSIIGGVVGIYICFSAIKIAKKGSLMLLDRTIDDKLNKEILNLLDNREDITSYHDLRSRISGSTIFLECHLVFSENISLLEAHSISDKVEYEIKNLSNEYQWVILIHLDPYDDSSK